jgi:hypothetical protein
MSTNDSAVVPSNLEAVTKLLDNVSTRIPGLFAEPVIRVFLEAVKIADNTKDNEKQCEELLELILSSLKTLESKLECGVKQGVDVSKVDKDHYFKVLSTITDYMKKLSKPTALQNIWRWLTSEQVLIYFFYIYLNLLFI